MRAKKKRIVVKTGKTRLQWCVLNPQTNIFKWCESVTEANDLMTKGDLYTAMAFLERELTATYKQI